MLVGWCVYGVVYVAFGLATTAWEAWALPGGTDIVIAALTGWGRQKDRRGTQDAGFDFHLVKPLPFGDLRHVLEQSASETRRRSGGKGSSDRTPIPTIDGDEQSFSQNEEAEADSEESPSSKIIHDLAGCFFGIRMAAEILENLEIGEQAKSEQVKRLATAIHGGCRKSCELVVEVRELLASGEN